MPEVHKAVARKDYPEAGIKRGQTYYWFKLYHGSKVRSLNRPLPSQMTGSPYLAAIRSLLERDPPHTSEDVEAFRDEVVEDLQNLQEEAQSSLDNMPEGLQESSESGQMLQERIDALDSAISDLEDLDIPDRSSIEDEEGTDQEAWDEALESYEDKESEEALEAAQDAKNQKIEEIDMTLESRLDEVREAIMEAIGGCEI